jgi:AraC-like DNA-binding protein
MVEKGRCENTNFLIRDMLGDLTDFRELNQRYISQITQKLNDRPRKTLDYRTPNVVVFELRQKLPGAHGILTLLKPLFNRGDFVDIAEQILSIVLCEPAAKQGISDGAGRETVKDLIKNPRIFVFDSFPDGSRLFRDMIAAAYWSTTESGILTAGLNTLQGTSGEPEKIRFSSGMLTEPHKHNYMELSYVIKGKSYQKIMGKDEMFVQGEICLLDKDSFHCEYLFQEEASIFFLLISNVFFSNSVNFEIRNKDYEPFLRNILITQREKFRFVRFTPKIKAHLVPELLGNIFAELRNPGPGSRYLILGYTERLLNTLPDEYDFCITKNDRDELQKTMFHEILDYMYSHYQDISINKLCSVFGYNADYFNRIIKSHTGMTYSRLLQSIRLEAAANLLKSSKFPVENIAEEVGYHNISYFYRIFFNTYGMTPNRLRVEL